jgi:hypothetical protein
LRTVMALTGSQEDAQRIAQAIHGEMDFATESTTTAPERLLPVLLCALAAHAWARTMVASIIPCSVSGSVANAASMRSHTPATHQRTKRLYTLFQAPYSRLKQPPLCAAPVLAGPGQISTEPRIPDRCSSLPPAVAQEMTRTQTLLAKGSNLHHQKRARTRICVMTV